MDGGMNGYSGIMDNHSPAQMPARRRVCVSALSRVLLVYPVCR